MKKRVKTGRPPIGTEAMMSPMPVRFPKEMRDRIEAIRAQRLDRPEVSAVIRELIAEALDARAGKAKGKR
jgi:hypothetical protein